MSSKPTFVFAKGIFFESSHFLYVQDTLKLTHVYQLLSQFQSILNIQTVTALKKKTPPQRFIGYEILAWIMGSLRRISLWNVSLRASSGVIGLAWNFSIFLRCLFPPSIDSSVNMAATIVGGRCSSRTW